MAENVNDGSGKLVFYNVANGALKRDAVQGDDESKIVTSTKGNKKYHVDNVSGRLVKISTHKSDYGVDLKVELKDDAQTSVVGMKLSSGFTKTFLKRLANVNIQEEVLISAFLGREFDHPVHGKILPTAISVKQKDEEGKWKPVANSYPEDSKIGVMDLLKEVAPIIEKISKLEQTFAPVEDDPIDAVETVDDSAPETIVEDDLPF